jgi:NhaP-type Na+/H+ or K+/H+ antiporter
MQTSINLSLVFCSLGGVAVGMLLGYALSRLLSRHQQIAEVAEVKAANAL